MRGVAQASVIAAAIGGAVSCGGEDPVEPGAATRPDPALVRMLADPFDGGAARDQLARLTMQAKANGC